MEEYGSHKDDDGVEETRRGESETYSAPSEDMVEKPKSGLMQAEERMTGSVAASVYTKYLRQAGGIFWAPVILALLFLAQGAQGKFVTKCKATVILTLNVQLPLIFSWAYGHHKEYRALDKDNIWVHMLVLALQRLCSPSCSVSLSGELPD